ncbi:MAG TPA: ABC transporter substrate-binding protein [Candidatus Eisenbacteria bacterium]|nr:ABC transporter substrate-binding protein [Candidatus Eisenbacteria bacterium]
MPSVRSWKTCLIVCASVALLADEVAWGAEKIRLALSTRNVVLMPFFYAKDKRLFDKYGLDVEIIQIRSNLQLAGLVAGELDFITGIGTAIEGIGKGMPLKAVAVLYRAPLFSLLSQLPDAKSLEGKKISVSRIGSESHFNGVVMLEKSGADPKKVTWIQTGSTALNMLPLERGLVEGAVLSPPFTGIMARKGYKILKRSGDVIDASPFNGLVTTREKIQKYPERLRNTLKAMLEAIKSIRQDRKGVIAYIMQSFAVDQGVAEEAYDDISGVLLDDMMMSEGGLKKYLEMIYGRGETNKPLTVNEIVDYSFLKALK